MGNERYLKVGDRVDRVEQVGTDQADENRYTPIDGANQHQCTLTDTDNAPTFIAISVNCVHIGVNEVGATAINLSSLGPCPVPAPLRMAYAVKLVRLKLADLSTDVAYRL